MDWFGGADDPAPQGRGNCLMAQANPQQWDGRTHLPDNLTRDSRLLRRAGTGRNDDGLRSKRPDVLHRDRIVSDNTRIASQLGEVPSQVMDEAVVIVDEQ